MALPTMDLPTYDLVIPSNKKKIKFRPFLVKEEKILLMALETDDEKNIKNAVFELLKACLLYTSPSPRDRQKSRMPSSA